MARKSKQIEEHFLNEVMFSKRFSPNQIEAIFDGEYPVKTQKEWKPFISREEGAKIRANKK